LYEDELQRALTEDGQRTSVFISPQTFSAQTGDGGFMNVDLTLPGAFAFGSNNGMVPDDGSSSSTFITPKTYYPNV
jgi:hypothetical protein